RRSTAQLYTLPLHDALPIYGAGVDGGGRLDQLRNLGGGEAGQGPRPGGDVGGGLRRREAERLFQRGIVLDADTVDEAAQPVAARSEEHTSELQSRENLVCRL